MTRLRDIDPERVTIARLALATLLSISIIVGFYHLSIVI